MSDSLVFLVASLLTLGLVGQILSALFDEKIRKRIKTYSIWYSIWLASVTIYWGIVLGIPFIEEEKYLKSHLAEIRQNVHESVEQAGGWNVLRSETERLQHTTNVVGYTFNSGNPLLWRFETIDRPELTNSFPLITKLNPWEIYFHTDSTNGSIVSVVVYFTQWGGGRYCTRCYTLALTPTNRDELPSSLVDQGDKILKLTNSVYEVTWQF